LFFIALNNLRQGFSAAVISEKNESNKLSRNFKAFSAVHFGAQ